MTEEQVIKYLQHVKDVKPFIYSNIKLLSPKVQDYRVDIKADNIIGLVYYQQQLNGVFKTTYNVKKYSVKKNFNMIRYIENPTEELQMIAIKEDSLSIRYIKNPTQRVQEYAVQRNSQRIKFIKNPTQKVKKIDFNRKK